jgi:putative flippase GtrA
MDRTLASARSIWQQFTLTRYLAASVIALAFDLAVFGMGISLGFDPALASAVGYCLGIVVHWLVSAQYVFVGKRRDGAALQLQRALFAGSALVGLGITVGVVALASASGLSTMTAKGAAVGISFLAVYALRKWGVFR